MDPDSMGIGITDTHRFNAVVTGGATNTLEWYVSGISGGDAIVGTITQGNPATYTAPDGIPAPATVVVRAVSVDDSTVTDSCLVTITFDRIYVNAITGSDITGIGGRNKPFKTITKGLDVAEAGQTVTAAPGVYDAANGETFPITVPVSVTLEGENWETCIIRVAAEAQATRRGVAMYGTGCGFRKFTLEEDKIVDTYWNNAVYLSGCANALVDSIRCLERANYAVLRVRSDHGTIVQNCYFVVDDGNLEDRGLEIVFNDDGNDTILRNLKVSGFYTGIEFNAFQNTLVEGCDLSGNYEGAEICCWQNASSQPNPDFGGGARGSLGGNNFSNNTSCGLSNETANAIYAMYNTWNNTPPVEGQDFCNLDSDNGGAVITQ
jgi:hypothetical protein